MFIKLITICVIICAPVSESIQLVDNKIFNRMMPECVSLCSNSLRKFSLFHLTGPAWGCNMEDDSVDSRGGTAVLLAMFKVSSRVQWSEVCNEPTVKPVTIIILDGC